MPYWQESDTYHDDPRWAALATGRRAVSVDSLQAAYSRLKSSAARHSSNGWLTAAQAAAQARRPVLELLASRPLANQPPFLHVRRDDCECFADWVPGYDYVIHRFLVKNPAKAETERYRNQKAERGDPRIRAQIYQRDGGCCRYCRSGPLKKSGMGNAKDRRRVIHYDHVHPDELAGDDLANLVVACARCNDEKGKRTPDEADMVLLPVPTDDERDELLARPEARLDRPKCGDTQRRDSASDSAATAVRTPVTTAVDTDVGTAVQTAVPTGEVRAETATDQQRQRPVVSTEGAGSGRVGQPVSVPELTTDLQPSRTPRAPDPYHGRSRPSSPRSTR